MDKLKMHIPDLAAANIERLAELFPACVTETRGEDGAVKRAIDFDLLRQELSDHIVEGPQERYRLDWPGKREALLAANAPIAKTLRPCREESVDFDTTQNLFIEGDNLDALKLLQETYLGKVKMIYIDPPYNTGNDFIYKDNFASDKKGYEQAADERSREGDRLVSNPETNGRFHSDWLTMIYSRLKLARNLLRDDGLVFISIDDNEYSNLSKVCNEVFGEENFIECFIWKKSYGGGPKEKYAVTQHEYVLLYGRIKNSVPSFKLKYDQAKVGRYYKGKDEHFEKRGPYRVKPLEATKSMDERPNLIYGIPYKGKEIWPQRQWLWSKDRVVKSMDSNGLIFVENDSGGTMNYKQYLRDENGVERSEKPFSIIDDIYTQEGTGDLRNLFEGKVVLQFPKPVSLIEKLIDIGLNGSGDEIVIDFFSGTATTAHAVMRNNVSEIRNTKYIMVQLPELLDESTVGYKAGYKNIAELGRERIRRAGQKIKSDYAEMEGAASLDTGFRVLKIDTSNMAEVHYTPDVLKQDDLLGMVDNVRPKRSSEDLLFQVLLDWGVDLTLPISREQINGREVFFVDGNALAACFAADGSVDEPFVKELAKRQPLRVVFRDAGFANDNARINVEQIFKTLSPATEVKTL